MTPERYAEAKRVFWEALEVPPDAREACVRRLCKNDTELIDEVLSLLSFHGSGTVLGTPQSDTHSNLDPANDTYGGASPLDALAGNAPPVDKAAESASRRAKRHRKRGPAEAGDVAKRPAGRLLHQAGQSVGRLTRQLGPGGHLALGIALATIILAVVGFVATSVAMREIRQLRMAKLADLLDANVMAMEVWIEQEKARVETGARDHEFISIVQQLAQLGEDAPSQQLRESPLQAQLHSDLRESFGEQARFALWGRNQRTLADWSPDGTGVGDNVTPYGAGLLAEVFDGKTVMQMPGFHDPITRGYPLAQRQLHIGVIAPVSDRDGNVIAALLVYAIGAEDRFQRLLSILELGDSGETYAFNRDGMMISESRFDDQLREIGLLPEDPQARSCLAIRLADPGGDMTSGYQSASSQDTQPLTKMARSAISKNDGEDGFGYRDYRGVKVIGVWRWLDDHNFGVATEIDYSEAFHEFQFVTWELAALYTLFAIAVAGVVGSYFAAQRSQRELREAHRLGPYTLETLLGEGGMGEVYLARHALLKRPTAVKLLKSEVTNPTTLKWFEREVQLVSQLTHPNTIEIYDYGRTDDGVFFYAMEYLPGVTLEGLVRRYGPLPPSRCVYLWRQVCLSLREAHAEGLIHRDIKPQNIMVCERGGESDVVKVLDFGLAKDVASPAANVSAASIRLAGTPRYMAPERFSSPLNVDHRVDIYACGAVAFKLLTGEDVYPAKTDIDAMLQAWSNPVPRVSDRTEQPIDPTLDRLVQACLAKAPDDRPGSIDEILRVLDSLQLDPPWNPEAARSWWKDRPRSGGVESPQEETSLSSSGRSYESQVPKSQVPKSEVPKSEVPKSDNSSAEIPPDSSAEEST